MGKHRRQRTPRNRKALAAAATAGSMSCTLVMGHATNRTAENVDVTLAASVVSVGGRGDSTSQRVANKLNGDYALGFAGDPVLIEYPANYLIQSSVDDGVPKLTKAVRGGGRVRVVAYSEGALVAEQVKRDLEHPQPGDPAPPTHDDLDFVLIASPYVPNGGLFARFPGFRVPGVLPEFSAAEPTKYDSTYVTREYDGFADFPAYFNPLSIANAVAGMAYAHPDESYDTIDFDDPRTVTTVVDNGAGGHDTYILVYNPHLPLLAPVRQASELAHLTPVTEPPLAAVEPVLRLGVDAGYTDRENRDPGTPRAFSPVTPPAKVAEAVVGVPDAVATGVHDGTNAAQASQSPRSSSKSLAPQRPRIDHPTVVFDGGRTSPATPPRPTGGSASNGMTGTTNPIAGLKISISNLTKAFSKPTESSRPGAADGRAD